MSSYLRGPGLPCAGSGAAAASMPTGVPSARRDGPPPDAQPVTGWVAPAGAAAAQGQTWTVCRALH
jgi:hypothetical protein